MRSVVAIAVAAPWVVWALVRTLGLELPYPFVALIAFTPYAALSSPLPVLVGAAAAAQGGRRGRGGGGARARVRDGAARGRPGREPEADGAAARGDDVEPVARAGGRAGRAADRARARRGRAERAGAATAADARGWTAVGASEQFPDRVARTRSGARRARACSRARRSRPSTRRRTAGPRAAGGRSRGRGRAAGPDQGRPPARRRSTRAAAPAWRGALAALPGSDGRGDVQILAGDFNATLDHPELRDLLDRGYIDAADAVGEGSTWTWPARHAARALPLTIDHVLVDRRVQRREGHGRARSRAATTAR